MVPSYGRWAGTHDQVTVICNTGYQFGGGDRTLTCINGYWIGIFPICVKSMYNVFCLQLMICLALPVMAFDDLCYKF